MSEKPTYLGLLNAISLGESAAHCYLTAWAEVTPSEEVKAVLLKVAAREGEHGMSFAKRINELGYQLRTKDDPGFEKRMAIASSTKKTDLEKMEKLGLGRLDTGDKPDFFDDIFKDHSIDIRTGELFGRYIAEERDSGRILRHCYQLLKQGAVGDSSPVREQIDALDSKVDALCAAVGQLTEIVSNQVSRTNGSTRAVKAR